MPTLSNKSVSKEGDGVVRISDHSDSHAFCKQLSVSNRPSIDSSTSLRGFEEAIVEAACIVDEMIDNIAEEEDLDDVENDDVMNAYPLVDVANEEADQAKVDVADEEADQVKVGAMMGDMGMDFEVPFGMVLDEIKEKKKARAAEKQFVTAEPGLLLLTPHGRIRRSKKWRWFLVRGHLLV
ncbi:hypothetical protein AMTR_s00072p00165680 [Amborella trichopoda]|uniref:Uncharacterized protein n=1 Tax=Amborella trichopoda TaxID=13333 RepID=W1NS71_AMBTC|nr:hypothetical protein AMTR_s00072p00165680 [Amborella trichopoda]